MKSSSFSNHKIYQIALHMYPILSSFSPLLKVNCLLFYLKVNQLLLETGSNPFCHIKHFAFQFLLAPLSAVFRFLQDHSYQHVNMLQQFQSTNTQKTPFTPNHPLATTSSLFQFIAKFIGVVCTHCLHFFFLFFFLVFISSRFLLSLLCSDFVFFSPSQKLLLSPVISMLPDKVVIF